ncbi:hypothetical protein ASG98_17765 [Bacillus sp. Soil531]|nr:hypothetical protein ASG98_17765 [Bacillus sp. Soil531]
MIENSKKENGYLRNNIKILQDAALIIALISAMGYYLAFSFEKGYRDFYGIEDISFTDIDIKSIVNSVYKIIPIIVFICIAYLITRFILWLIIPFFEKSMEKFNDRFLDLYKNEENASDSMLLLLRVVNRSGNQNIKSMGIVIRFYIPFFTAVLVTNFILGKSNSGFVFILAIFLALAWLIFFILVKITFKIKGHDTDNVNFINPITFIWTYSNWNTKIILCVLSIIGVGYVFYQYGYTDAEEQEDYFVVEIDSKNLLILDKNDKSMLVAPINLENPILKSDFQFIPIKSDKDTVMNLKKITIDGGLQVMNNPRQRQLNKIINETKERILSLFK